MSIRELFNAILDTDISILIGVFFAIVFFLMWGSFVYEVSKNINGILENWLDRKLGNIEYNSLFIAIVMFFPMLFIRLLPLSLMIILEIIILFLPLVLLALFLDT
tara:strand:+ start:155 stop:469 length:315 start_codon:yes stop_codon:yes gene_type:complete